MVASLIEVLQAAPALYLGLAAILGLLVGSFLNVVVLRLPVMIERRWREEPDEDEARFDLVAPASHCPACGHRLSILENVPLLSYLWLRGRCRSCGAGIPLRYPLVELTTAVLTVVTAWHFGPGVQALAACALTWMLIALSGIDIDHQLLPDDITLPGLWLGLILSLFSVFTTPEAAIVGAVAGYLSLWSIYHLFRLLTGKHGMGYGDFKLLAMLGAWMGWQALLPIVLLSSLVGAIVGIAQIVLLGRDRRLPIPFGPYLAAAGWITLLWGERIVQAYLTWSGLGR